MRPEESVYQAGTQKAHRIQRTTSTSAAMMLQKLSAFFSIIAGDYLKRDCKEVTQVLVSSDASGI